MLRPLLVCLLLVVSAPALSQDKTATDYRMVSISQSNMLVMDFHNRRMTKEGDALSISVLFYPSSKKLSSGVSVDYIMTLGKYFCSKPGQYSVMSLVGFAENAGAPIFDEAGAGPVESSPRGSIAYSTWEAACKGLPEAKRLSQTRQVSNAETLRAYRKSLSE